MTRAVAWRDGAALEQRSLRHAIAGVSSGRPGALVFRPTRASRWLHGARVLSEQSETAGLGADGRVWASKRVRARGISRYAFSLGDDADSVARSARRYRGPTSVFALAAVAESGDQFEYRVEYSFERFGVALDLGEEQAAL